MTDKTIFRIWDKVRVKNPEVFVRCGYTLDVKEVAKYLEEHHSGLINGFVHDLFQSVDENFFPNRKKEDISKKLSFNTKKFLGKIPTELAYRYCKRRGFGGDERKIFKEREDFFQDKEGRVMSKCCVKTGFRVPGHAGSWEDDYEPPYLDETGTHIILKIKFDEGHIREFCADDVEKL